MITRSQALVICVPLWVWMLVSWRMLHKARSMWREQERKLQQDRMEWGRKTIEGRSEKGPGGLEIRRDRFEQN